MMRAMAIAALALAACGPVRAEAIYKCVSAGKPASYQHEPCAGGARTAAVHADQPEASKPRPPVARQAPSRPSARRKRAVSVRRATGVGNDCRHTKDAREAWERRIGLGRTYESLQRWNDRVREACR